MQRGQAPSGFENHVKRIEILGNSAAGSFIEGCQSPDLVLNESFGRVLLGRVHMPTLLNLLTVVNIFASGFMLAYLSVMPNIPH
jgi:hypothetical protein